MLFTVFLTSEFSWKGFVTRNEINQLLFVPHAVDVLTYVLRVVWWLWSTANLFKCSNAWWYRRQPPRLVNLHSFRLVASLVNTLPKRPPYTTGHNIFFITWSVFSSHQQSSLPKLYSFSVSKFMHSYHNKLLSNHFDEYFVPLSSIHYHSTRLATSKNLFLPRVNSSSGKCSRNFIGPKVWSSIPDDIKFSITFTFKWKLKKHLLCEKNSQLWTLATSPLSRTKYCVF